MKFQSVGKSLRQNPMSFARNQEFTNPSSQLQKKQETVYSHVSLREKQEVSLLLDVVEDLFCKVFQ